MTSQLIENNSKKPTDNLESKAGRQLVITPNIFILVSAFMSQCTVAPDKPILIAGDTGVGKSLFLKLFEKIYREKHKEEDFPIITINCANYPPTLARSELFGYKKGAFTDAKWDKSGLIEGAEGGILILEEVGELSEDTQASLLTVIEDKWFYPVGGTEKKSINDITFIAATSSLKTLREDFRNRFITFEVPPLYMRRIDVLFYAAYMHPDVVREFTYKDTLEFLTHNWPGNVREIEQVCIKIKLRKHWEKMMDPIFKVVQKFLFPPGGSPYEFPADRYYKKLVKLGIDVTTLEKFLNGFGIGLFNEGKSFPNFEAGNFTGELEKKVGGELYGFDLRLNYGPFARAVCGYMLFCALFFKDPAGNYDCLSHKPTSAQLNVNLLTSLTKEGLQVFRKLMRSIFEKASGIYLPKTAKIPLAYDKRIHFFNNLADANPSNEYLANITGRRPAVHQPDLPDIYEMSHEDAMKHYYAEVLRRAPSVAEAARRLKVNEQTLHSTLRRLGIKKAR